VNLDTWLRWLQDTSIGTAIRENATLFPWVEAVHVLGLTVVLGSVALLDLRLLGWVSRDRSVRKVLADVLPCTWSAFAIAGVTGALLFSSNAVTYAENTFFRVKMVLLVFLFANSLVFSWFTTRDIDAWDDAPQPPLRARASGALSLGLWIAIVVCGRWIGFTRL
jgi:hypothetical protein